jgi:hypothetical protein
LRRRGFDRKPERDEHHNESRDRAVAFHPISIARTAAVVTALAGGDRRR